MRVVLAGHEGSKKILTASSWLIDKYLPQDFRVHFLNFGEFHGKLYRGTYIPLDDSQVGGSMAWSKYIREFIKTMTDDFIVLGLDDYLLSATLDTERFEAIQNLMFLDDSIVCGRLCQSGFYSKPEVVVDGEFIQLTPQAGYSVTTQYCIWRREYLVSLLERTTTPWDFELEGSRILNGDGVKVIGTLTPAMKFPDASCLSPGKWHGVKVWDADPVDISRLVEMGHLKREDLC